ncbi:MAG: DUF393 domain-containing protein [Patescibacteria group bacterium]
MAAAKPTLLYDADCGFCAKWVEHWHRKTGEAVEYAPYQTHGHHFPQVSPAAARKAVQLVMPDGKVYSAAEAVFRTLALGGVKRYLLWLCRYFPLFAPISEWVYHFVATHRHWFGKPSGALVCTSSLPGASESQPV